MKRFTASDPAALAALGIGLDRLDLRQPAAAISPLEQAVTTYEQFTKVTPVDLAHTRFGLARALAESGRDPARAQKLAEAARDAYVAAGRPTPKELAEINAWLKRRQSGHVVRH